MAVMKEQDTDLDELFVGQAVVEFVDSVDRYSRKPNGSEDQGHRDEND